MLETIFIRSHEALHWLHPPVGLGAAVIEICATKISEKLGSSMTDWTAGYVADIGYTFGYYTELNPLRIKLAFLNAGLMPPEIGTACELGFGQGVSTNLHAAASVVQWSGTDFNPSQAAFAQNLAKASGTGARLYDEAFEQFCTRDDLPDFDFICLHGIWSWVSDANRHVIVDFVRRKLKVGGVLYLSYNTQPAWAAMIPMRNLMTQHAQVMGTEGSGIVNRIDGALGFAKQLLAITPAYTEANPKITERIDALQSQNRNYLAHEYFNRDWQPMSFAEMAKWFDDAKLQWVSSAHYVESIDNIRLSPEQQQFLAEIQDPVFRESVRDFCVNRQFRKDYWVKGAVTLSPLALKEAVRNQRFLLIKPRAEIDMFAPIADLMSDHQIVSFHTLEKILAKHPAPDVQLSHGQLLQALMILCSSGAVHAVQDDADIAKAKPYAQKLNLHLLQMGRGSDDVSFLASPVTGGGIAVERFAQWFLLARLEGKNQPQEIAEYVLALLLERGQGVVKDGQILTTREASLNELVLKVQAFEKQQLPLLQALGIA